MKYLPPDDVILAAERFARDDGASIERAACHFPAADSGRAVRALIASLLL
jgi:hypothetical protein